VEFDSIVELIEGAGYDARSYSGRFMFGKECLGVTCDDPIRFMLDVLVHARAEDTDDNPVFEDIAVVLKNYRTDDMGRSQIIYFPSVEWEGKESSDDENEE